MRSRRTIHTVVAAAAALVGGLVTAAPARAAVAYDPLAKTGFVDAADVRDAFRWTDATLAARAAGLEFDHEFWIDDTYSVACGGAAFPVVHQREFGRYALTSTVAHGGRGQAGAYGKRLKGFTLSGAHAGISGTSVEPAVGQPCPRGEGGTIDRSAFVRSISGWALSVSSSDGPSSDRVRR
jgi:hypothetical protein